MSSVFIINNTDGTLNLSMPPGSLNGPGSGTRDTDLRMYGQGAFLWGEGVNENILRIAENFACEEKAGSPGVPKDEGDLNPGLGITNPLVGQGWFNKTDKQQYFYTGTNWVKTSAVFVNATQPAVAEAGELWYDTSNGNPCAGSSQLKIYNGTTWVSTAGDYLSLCGGTMSDDINMGGNSILNLAMPAGSNATDAANRGYVDTAIDAITGPGGALTLHTANNGIHITSTQNLFLDRLETDAQLNLSSNYSLLVNDLDNLLGYSSSTGTIYSAVNSKLPISGGTVTGNLTLGGAGHANGPGLAATENYVDDQVSALAGQLGAADYYVRYWSTEVASGPVNGDIHTSGTTIKIYAGGLWHQIHPAQYS